MAPNDLDILPGVHFESVAKRCVRLRDGDYAELRELDEIMRRAYEDGEVDKVGTMAKLLLRRDHLPPLYKAKAWAYLSSCDGEDGWNNVLLAESWMQEARRLQSGTGYIPRELDQWMDIIARQKAQLNDIVQAEHAAQKDHKDEALDLAIRPASSAATWQPDMLDGTMDQKPASETGATKDESKSGAGSSAPFTAATEDAEGNDGEKAKAKKHIATWADAQKTRQDLAKVPRSICKKLSVQSFHGGGGSLQALQQSRLRPKKSVSKLGGVSYEQEKSETEDMASKVHAHQTA